MILTSSAFSDGESIPARYTCDGDGAPPPLLVSDIPEGTESLILTVTDPDAPGGTFLHWEKRDIHPEASDLSGGSTMPNSTGKREWTPPCPPRGTHRYVFTVVALSGKGEELARAVLTGVYTR